MFQINRVGYDAHEQKLFKDNSRFDFDKTIYIDLFLNKNREIAERTRLELKQMKKELNELKMQHSQYIDPNGQNIVGVLEEAQKIMTQ